MYLTTFKSSRWVDVLEGSARGRALSQKGRREGRGWASSSYNQSSHSLTSSGSRCNDFILSEQLPPKQLGCIIHLPGQAPQLWEGSVRPDSFPLTTAVRRWSCLHMGPSVDNKGRLSCSYCPVLWFYIVEIEPHYIAQTGLELEILLPQVPGSCST